MKINPADDRELERLGGKILKKYVIMCERENIYLIMWWIRVIVVHQGSMEKKQISE